MSKYSDDQITQMARHTLSCLAVDDPRWAELVNRMSKATGMHVIDVWNAINASAARRHPLDP